MAVIRSDNNQLIRVEQSSIVLSLNVSINTGIGKLLNDDEPLKLFKVFRFHAKPEPQRAYSDQQPGLMKQNVLKMMILSMFHVQILTI